MPLVTNTHVPTAAAAGSCACRCAVLNVIDGFLSLLSVKRQLSKNKESSRSI